jgi:hypothetical protein
MVAPRKVPTGSERDVARHIEHSDAAGHRAPFKVYAPDVGMAVAMPSTSATIGAPSAMRARIQRRDERRRRVGEHRRLVAVTVRTGRVELDADLGTGRERVRRAT